MQKKKQSVARPTSITILSLLLALNGVFMASYILSLSSGRVFSFDFLFRLLPEIAITLTALFSAYGMWKLKPWSFPSAIFSVGMIAHSLLGQIRNYSSTGMPMLYLLAPLCLIIAAVYYFRKRIFLSVAY